MKCHSTSGLMILLTGILYLGPVTKEYDTKCICPRTVCRLWEGQPPKRNDSVISAFYVNTLQQLYNKWKRQFHWVWLCVWSQFLTNEFICVTELINLFDELWIVGTVMLNTSVTYKPFPMKPWWAVLENKMWTIQLHRLNERHNQK